jgi:6,7-dimethyl-8-ribityllumazine synthase
MAELRRARPPIAAPGRRILVVEARFYVQINDLLLAGARACLDAAGASIEHVVVPGALEIPPAIALLHASVRAEAFVALGCVIRGETTHYELVAGESARGLMDLGVHERALIGNGILTVESEAQALARADPAQGDKGGDAAYAALSLLALRDRLRG